MGSKVSSELVGETNPECMELVSKRWHVEQVFTHLEGPEKKFMDERGYLSSEGCAPFSPSRARGVRLGC